MWIIRKEVTVLTQKENNRPNALETAGKLVRKDRQKDYDSPSPNMRRTAKIWTGILDPILQEGTEVSPEQVAMCMIGLKLAREAYKHKPDNLCDIAGWTDVLECVIYGDHEKDGK